MYTRRKTFPAPELSMVCLYIFTSFFFCFLSVHFFLAWCMLSTFFFGIFFFCIFRRRRFFFSWLCFAQQCLRFKCMTNLRKPCKTSLCHFVTLQLLFSLADAYRGVDTRPTSLQRQDEWKDKKWRRSTALFRQHTLSLAKWWCSILWFVVHKTETNNRRKLDFSSANVYSLESK